MPAATWTTERAKHEAMLVVAAVEQLTEAVRTAVVEEGERLMRFVQPEAKTISVRIVD